MKHVSLATMKLALKIPSTDGEERALGPEPWLLLQLAMGVSGSVSIL